jgi:phage terminase large subunit-like protein
VPGALWPLDWIEAGRVDIAPPLARVVVAVDPSGSDGVGGDSQGIVVTGKGLDGDAYILADRSCRLGPAGWARQAADAYDEFAADKLVAEVNYGGAMVESTLKLAHPTVAYKQVTASRGKHVRAEPVAALYETRWDDAGIIIKKPRVHHVGRCPELEEQLGMFTTAGYQGAGSPDRADALVWALTELMLGSGAQGWLEYAREQLAESEARKGH